jgi:putative oxidoreductase
MRLTFDLNGCLLLRWLLGGLLLWAAISKVANPQDFYASLMAYKLPIPAALLKLVAITLPWLELLCGLMLLAQVRLQAALLWAVVLFALFAIVTGQAWARGLNISCGCLKLDIFGLENRSLKNFLESTAFACARAVLLCAGAILLFRMRPNLDARGDAT